MTQPPGIGSNWLKAATADEVARLAKLEVWIKARERSLADLREERQKIMRRCIHRNRRKEGKT